ncbi:hypothetical protein AB0K40_17995 [Nonomuraea bangladeshensis]|uniref:Uncharacterized protein n=1 Tax=Nonomuraea bangladeshensis TaxID=404385 RepID=A0ABV3H4D8_9ACTN
MTRQHGTRQRYLLGPDEHDQPGKGCHCTPCTKANSAAVAAARRRAAVRRWNGTPAWADAEPVRQHIRALMAQGPGWERIADVAGVARSTVRSVLYRIGGRERTQRMRPELAERLLAVRLEQLLKPRTYIDATGTRRRIQALAAIGWTLTEQGHRIGRAPTSMCYLALARGDKVTAAVAARVAALYDELSMTPAPESDTSRRSRARAETRGWAPPLAWDDETIDDPAAVPDLGQQVSRAVAVAENADELARQGLSPQQVAERLGVHLTYLGIARKRAREQVPA